MYVNLDGIEFIILMIFSPAIIGFIMGFFKRTNWITVIVISIFVEIFFVTCLYIYDYNPNFHTFIDTLPFIPFSLVTWLIVRGIKRWIEKNEKNQSN